MKEKAGTVTPLGSKGRIIGDQTANQVFYVVGLMIIFCDDGNNAVPYPFDNGNEEVEGVQTVARGVFGSGIVVPLFTFHVSLPLKQIGMYHLMASAEVWDAQI